MQPLSSIVLVMLIPSLVWGGRFQYNQSEMLCLVNKQRSRYGLPALGLDRALVSAAQYHSNEQAQYRTMTHSDRRGRTLGQRITQAGFPQWQSVGENVAFGYNDETSCMDAWMKSPGHRANILNHSYTHMGSAVAWSGDNTPYFTQDFAGDGKTHHFPLCPNSHDSDDQPSYSNNNGNDDNYRQPDDYSNQNNDVDSQQYQPTPTYSSPQNDSGYDSNVSDNHQTGRRKRRCRRRPKQVQPDHDDNSYGNAQPDHDDNSYGNVQPDHDDNSYGNAQPDHDDNSYGNVQPDHDDNSYGNAQPDHDVPVVKKPCKKNKQNEVENS